MEAAAKKTARHRAREGRAKSLSAFVSEAVDEKLRYDALQDILAAMAKSTASDHGRPTSSMPRWSWRLVSTAPWSSRAMPGTYSASTLGSTSSPFDGHARPTTARFGSR